jgi:hypothetical protein
VVYVAVICLHSPHRRHFISFRTNELIGFATTDVIEMFLADYLTTRVLNVDSNVYVARYDTGSIISASPNADYGLFEKLPNYDDIKKGMDRQLETYMNVLRSTQPDSNQSIDQPIFLTPLVSGDIITASFLPVPPKTLDGADGYRPVAFVVQRMPVDVFDVVNDVQSDIDADVWRSLCFSVAIGVGGLILVTAILAGMSSILTSPLTFITKVASQVVNNVLAEVEGPLNDSNERQRLSYDDPTNAARDYIIDYNSSRCTPKTEVNLLVEEFQRMIQCFSRVGASSVAEPPLFEINNELVWHSDFARLYHPSGLSKMSFRETSVSTQASESMSGHDPPVEMTATLDDAGNPSANTVTQTLLHSTTLQHLPDEDNPEREQDLDGRELEMVASGTLHGLSISEDHSENFASVRARSPGSRAASVRFSVHHPTTTAASVVPAPARLNPLPLLEPPKSEEKPFLQREHGTKKTCCSSLFWWVVVLMALPILIANFVIGAIVSSSLSGNINVWSLRAEEASTNIERQNLVFVADRKASTLATLVQTTVRDLHVMTRITNWLFFGGIQRSGSLTECDTASEECKLFVSNESQCPSYTPERMPCACDWKCPQEDASVFGCQQFGNITDSRFVQRQNFLVQSRDSDPATGNREGSSGFPAHSFSPETTHWWTNISSLPDAQKGPSAAAGYGTLYDRVAVSSAASVFNFPIYNYATSLNSPKPYLGGYLTFENDGLFVGWTGCRQLHVLLVGFECTIENGATLVDPQLCPEGKFGYDPRCRSWYADGRSKYQKSFTPVHISGEEKFQRVFRSFEWPSIQAVSLFQLHIFMPRNLLRLPALHRQ